MASIAGANNNYVHNQNGTNNGSIQPVQKFHLDIDGHVNGRAANGNALETSHPPGTLINGKGDGDFSPVAICGMACRLPGGLHSPEELWDFLLAGGDARSRVPETRYNASAYYSPNKKPGTIVTEMGYFLDESVNLGALDASFFSMARTEIERLDPQQRLLLEVARESVDDAGEVDWKGQNIGVYVGTYGQDWYDVFHREALKYSAYQILATHDFMISERVSHEMDLRGPRYE